MNSIVTKMQTPQKRSAPGVKRLFRVFQTPRPTMNGTETPKTARWGSMELYSLDALSRTRKGAAAISGRAKRPIGTTTTCETPASISPPHTTTTRKQ